MLKPAGPKPLWSASVDRVIVKQLSFRGGNALGLRVLVLLFGDFFLIYTRIGWLKWPWPTKQQRRPIVFHHAGGQLLNLISCVPTASCSVLIYLPTNFRCTISILRAVLKQPWWRPFWEPRYELSTITSFVWRENWVAALSLAQNSVWQQERLAENTHLP